METGRGTHEQRPNQPLVRRCPGALTFQRSPGARLPSSAVRAHTHLQVEELADGDARAPLAAALATSRRQNGATKRPRRCAAIRSAQAAVMQITTATIDASGPKAPPVISALP